MASNHPLIVNQENQELPSPLLPVPCLTMEEKIVLRAIAGGKDAKEVRTELHISSDTMFRILYELRKKTGAADYVGLGVWAVRQMKNNNDQRSARREA